MDIGRKAVSRKNNLICQRIRSLIVLAISVLILPALAVAAPSDGDVRIVDAIGTSFVSGGNSVIARDAALDDALRKAVEQAVGTLVSSDTMVENYQVLKDSVYTRTQGYIKNYTVINEALSGDLYQVTVRATVAVGNLKNDLDAVGVLHAKAGKPRVLFMIAEQNIGHKYYVFWWWGRAEYKGETVDMSAAEAALKELFLSKGFNVVDISGSLETFDIANSFRVADLTDAQAKEIGNRLNAEIVVKGKAFAKEGPRTPGSQVASYIADAAGQAIRVDTGTVLASAAGHGVARHVSEVSGGTEAIGKAATDMGDKLIDQILAKWTSGQMIILRISGVRDYKKLADFKDTVKKRVRGVTNVYQRKLEEGVAVFELETKVPAQNIADDLVRLPGLGLKVTGATHGTVDAVMEAD